MGHKLMRLYRDMTSSQREDVFERLNGANEKMKPMLDAIGNLQVEASSIMRNPSFYIQQNIRELREEGKNLQNKIMENQESQGMSC